MIAIAAFALLTLAEPPEALPVDARMAEFEAAMPWLRRIEERAEAEIWQLGPAEPGWTTSGLSPEAAIAARGGKVEEHVLGEWLRGGHGVSVAGDHPLTVPPGLHRYLVRGYEGPVDYHSYHRITPGVVIHTFGAATRIGNAHCQRSQGVELIAQEAWRSWPTETAILAFAVARITRDDPRTYCILYRLTGGGRVSQLAYTSEGRPYLTANQDPETFAITPRAEAAERMFSAANRPPVGGE
jgi:hypothetical protein